MGALEEEEELEKGWKGAGRGLVRTRNKVLDRCTQLQTHY